MQLIGQAIRHEQFGKGVVTACDKNVLTVCFQNGSKRFLYPDAFEDHLTLKDDAMQQEIRGVLAQRRARHQTAVRRELNQQKKWNALRSVKISATGQAVFDLACQEQDPFQTGTVKMGVYLSGLAKGEPRVPDRVHGNSLCILTGCPAEQPEEQRQILAVAMAKEDFLGGRCTDGIIPLHPVYRLRASQPLPLWHYFGSHARMSLGRTGMQYLSNLAGEEILHDLRDQWKNTPQESLAEEFYKYYCTWNKLRQR